MEAQKENPLTVDCLAAETEQGAGGAAALPGRIDRYSKARQRSWDMESFARGRQHVKEADKLAKCGEYLLFRNYFTVDVVRLHAAEFCKQHLLCPLCAIRRGAKLLKSYLEAFAFLQDKQPQLKPYLVTFTVKNGDDLGERMKHLRKSLQLLHKRRHRPRDRSEVKKAQAGVWSYEVTNRGNGWHPHAHAVWLCSSEPDQAALRQEWKDITGDSFMVDVTPFTGDPVKAFCEVFKYAVKFSEMTPEDTFHAYEVLSGSRLVASFGDFRNVTIPEEYTDAELPADLPYIEILYRFVRGRGTSGGAPACGEEPRETGQYNFVQIEQERKPGGNPNLKVPERPKKGRAKPDHEADEKKRGVRTGADGRRFFYSFLPAEKDSSSRE